MVNNPFASIIVAHVLDDADPEADFDTVTGVQLDADVIPVDDEQVGALGDNRLLDDYGDGAAVADPEADIVARARKAAELLE